MKNNLLALKCFDMDARVPPTHNDFLELVIRHKMEEIEDEEEEEFADIISEIKDILERDYLQEEDDEDEMMEETEPFYCERLKTDFSTADDDNLLHAGYVDCMEEAIRFLVEEENLSPEHPVVVNLRSHLEKSKDRVLQSLSVDEYQPNDCPLSDIFLETFQNCRDSG